MTPLLITFLITFICFIICLAFYSINYGKYAQSIGFGLAVFVLAIPIIDYIVNF